MFDAEELEGAIEIQTRCYELLIWTEGAIGRGFIRFDHVHHYASDTDAAERWLAQHYRELPERCRPLRPDGRPLTEFARFFASYLRTSFDLQPAGYRLVSSCGCSCPICSWLVAASHLIPKKVTARDKRRASSLKRAYLESLVREEGRLIDADEIGGVLDKPSLSRSAALGAYGRELLRIIHGQGLPNTGRLALWREFAWSRRGAPLPTFQLRSSDILQAESELLSALGGTRAI